MGNKLVIEMGTSAKKNSISSALMKDVYIQRYCPIILRKWFANSNGYFWLPCLKCKKSFGGFECGSSESILKTPRIVTYENNDTSKIGDDEVRVIKCTSSSGTMVCPCCSLDIIKKNRMCFSA
jgi:hypothetical protein